MISGATRLFAIIADPIAQVRTPQAMNAYFQAAGADAIMVPIHVPATDLAIVMAGLRSTRNFGGMVVTVPHKAAVVGYCDELGPAARAVGAANTVRRTAEGALVGDMFDGAGFLGGLRAQGHDPAGARVLLLGAGGAAAAIAVALAGAGVQELVIANRTRAKAEAIAVRVRAAHPDARVRVADADPAGYGLVVNATSLGLRMSDPLPIDAERLDPGTIVAEVVMKPERTPLLARAQQRGCVIHYGRHMLEAQVRLIGDFLLGTGPHA